MNLLYFVILVSSLIFVHELGHFLFAKAFGVKVITFSLGFGPKLLKLRGRETEYCISLLPLGGYVEMLEASKIDVVLPEDRKRTFESLPVFKRLVIVLAGPVMNLVFPVLLYFAVFVGDGPFLPPTIGIVLPNHPADGKLLPGDRIMSIDGQEVGTFDEVKRIIGSSPAKTLKITVFRDNRHTEVEVTAEEAVEHHEDLKTGELDMSQRVGTIGILPSAPAAVIGVPNPDSPAYRAGLRTFDVITNVGGMPVKRFMDLTNALSENAGETLPVTYLRPVGVPGALGGLVDMAVFESGVVALTPDPSGSTLFERAGIELADLYLAIVPPDSYLYKAGLRPGDKILRLDEELVPAWFTFEERVKAAPDKQHRIDFQAARDGRVRSGTFQIRREDYRDASGQTRSYYIFPQQHWIPLSAEERVEHPTPIRYAFTKAVEETVDVTRFTMVCIVRILQGRLSLKSLSGPLAIYEIAGEEGRKGADNFVWVMALLSINLGLLNLLPIPVLDGGHIMFMALEGALRRPLSLRTRELMHIVGMAILVGLMAVAFKNDVAKRWDVIRGQIERALADKPAATEPEKRQPNARSIAAKVVERVLSDDAFVAATLDAELRRHPQLDTRERALATELSYGTLRTEPALRARLFVHAPRGVSDQRVLSQLLVAAYQILLLDRVPAFAAVDAAVTGVKRDRGPRVAGFANAVLRKLCKTGEKLTQAQALREAVPAWLWQELTRAVGDEQALALIAGEAFTGLRLRVGAAVPPWLAELPPGSVSPVARLVRGEGDPRQRPGFAEGSFTVQEEGAQVIGLSLGARGSEKVLDACAGRGQKSTLVAERLGAGRLVACDLYPEKLEALGAETARLGLPAIETRAVDWCVGQGGLPDDFDRVLVDAPCSGTGTLRRRPEILRRLGPEDPARLGELSEKILRSAASRARPGGTVLFAVCSVLRQECEDVMARVSDVLEPAPFDAPELPAELVAGKTVLRLLPGQHGTDGYFMACFRRR